METKGNLMIRHCVLLKFLPDTSSESKQAALEGIRDLPSHIPQIISYSVGFDSNLRDDNFDLAVVGDFKNTEDYLIYASHEKHLEIISDLLAPHLASRSAVQYEL